MSMITPEIMLTLHEERLADLEHKRVLREQPDRQVRSAWVLRLAAFLRRTAARLEAAPVPQGETSPA